MGNVFDKPTQDESVIYSYDEVDELHDVTFVRLPSCRSRVNTADRRLLLLEAA